MKKQKVAIMTICVMLTLIFALSGCGGSNSGDNDSVKINDFSSERKKFANLKEFAGEKYVNITFDINKDFSKVVFKQTLNSFENSELRYYGELKEGRPHGKGILGGLNGNWLYIGNFTNGKMNGYGTRYQMVTLINNNEELRGGFKSYEGYFKDNLHDGKGNEYDLVFRDEDGKRKVNEIIAKIDLQSVRINSDFLINDKTYYDLTEFLPVWIVTGTFEDGKAHGKCKVYKIDKLIYDGDFKNGNHHGKGTRYRENGSKIYEGQLEKGMPHGEGTSYYEDGKVQYKGEFKDGKYHGKGTLYNPDGSVKYKGNWKNGDVA